MYWCNKVPFILEKLQNKTASVGFELNYPWDYFFRNEIYFFVHHTKLNFLVSVWFLKTLLNFKSTFRANVFSMGNKSCWTFVRFHEIPRNSLTNRCWKFHLCILIKRFIPKQKVWSVPSIQDSSFWNQQMAPNLWLWWKRELGISLWLEEQLTVN